MNEFVGGVLRLVLRLVLVAMGLVLFLSLLAAALGLALVWALRAAAVLATLAVFALYTRPGFMVMLADQMWSCV